MGWRSWLRQESVGAVHRGAKGLPGRWRSAQAPEGGITLQRRLAQSSAADVPLPNPLTPRATVRGNLGDLMGRLRPGEKMRLEVAMSRAPEPRNKVSLLVGAFVALMLCDIAKEVAKERLQREGTVEAALKDPSVGEAISGFIHERVVPHVEEKLFLKEAERLGLLAAAMERIEQETERQCTQKLQWNYSAGPVVGLFSLNTGPYQGLDFLPFSLWNSRKVATASAEFHYKRSDDARKTLRLIAFFRNDYGFYRLLALAAYDADQNASPMRIYHFQGGYAGYLDQQARQRYFRVVTELCKDMGAARTGVEAVEEMLGEQQDNQSLQNARLKLSDADREGLVRAAVQEQPICQAPYSTFRDSAFAVKSPSVLERSAREQEWSRVLQQGQVLSCAIRFPRGKNLFSDGKATSQFTWDDEKATEDYHGHLTGSIGGFGEHSSPAEDLAAPLKKVKIHKMEKERPSRRSPGPADDSQGGGADASA